MSPRRVRAGPVFKPEVNLIEFGDLVGESEESRSQREGRRQFRQWVREGCWCGDFSPSPMRGQESGESVRVWSGSESGHERACAPRA